MPWKDTQSSRLRRLFMKGFSAMDIAEPLVSFDADADADRVRNFMQEKNYDLAGVRKNGLVCGYVRRKDLQAGLCGDYLCYFTPDDDLVPDTASLIAVVASLAINERCFVTILDRVGGIITLSDLEKPPMRMFLFGMITITEMLITEIIRKSFPQDSWKEILSSDRLDRAIKLREERARRGQEVELIDCLQFGDKGWIITYDDELRATLGHSSRREARKAVKEWESLRNNLAHTQEIIPTGWQRIVLACSRLESNMEKFLNRATDDMTRAE